MQLRICLTTLTSKWVKLGTLFLENENLNSKVYFNREEKFKNKKSKRSKEEPRKNQEKAKKKENLFVVFVLSKRQRRSKQEPNKET